MNNIPTVQVADVNFDIEPKDNHHAFTLWWQAVQVMDRLKKCRKLMDLNEYMDRYRDLVLYTTHLKQYMATHH